MLSLFLKQIFEREKSSAQKPPSILPGSVIINIENPKSFNIARSIESQKLVANVDNGGGAMVIPCSALNDRSQWPLKEGRV